jgi:hypothetical protein
MDARKFAKCAILFGLTFQFTLGIAAENLFALFARKKFGANSPTRRGTPKMTAVFKPKYI